MLSRWEQTLMMTIVQGNRWLMIRCVRLRLLLEPWTIILVYFSSGNIGRVNIITRLALQGSCRLWLR